MTDRFDLEQDIMQTWAIIDDLKLLQNSELRNAIIAIYDAKFAKLFETFSELIEERKL